LAHFSSFPRGKVNAMIYLILGVLLVISSSAANGPPLLRAVHAYFNLAGSIKRLCPESGSTTWIHIDTSRTAHTVLTNGLADIQVKIAPGGPGGGDADRRVLPE
jgi:hypothetical protein